MQQCLKLPRVAGIFEVQTECLWMRVKHVVRSRGKRAGVMKITVDISLLLENHFFSRIYEKE